MASAESVHKAVAAEKNGGSKLHRVKKKDKCNEGTIKEYSFDKSMAEKFSDLDLSDSEWQPKGKRDSKRRVNSPFTLRQRKGRQRLYKPIGPGPEVKLWKPLKDHHRYCDPDNTLKVVARPG